MTTPEDASDQRSLLVQVYELCPRCEFMAIPPQWYSERQASTSRACPARCGATLEAVVLRARHATTAADRLTLAFADVLAGTDWTPSADDLALLVDDSALEELGRDGTGG
ncbi:hypothetical protein [Streptomyces sp. NPDC004296]|uniref:hypothetical protein n=1 Tax=Streptomyces sp. NPDC004296 TaxID=3364697 RepID=UPI003682D351